VRNARVNRIIPLFIVALICGCRSLPQEYSKAPGRSLVQGKVTFKNAPFHPKTALFGPFIAPPDPNEEPQSHTEVHIINADGHPLPTSNEFYVADKVWLTPGAHQITVFCFTKYLDQVLTRGTNIQIDVQAGYNYYLRSKPLKIVTAHPLVVSLPELDMTTEKAQ